MWQIGGHFGSTGIIPTVTQAPLLLDSYTGAAWAYSLRKLRNGYAGAAVRIRRSSDDAEQDFGFDASGNFDAASAATFIGGGTGYITAWYDQSGNGIDVVQATAANQPQYTAVGVGGLPTIQFVNANSTFLVQGQYSQTIMGGDGTQCTNFSVFSYTNITQIQPVWAWSTGAGDASLYLHSDGAGAPAAKIEFNYPEWFNSGEVLVSEPVGWSGNDHILECNRDSSNLFEVTADGTNLYSAIHGAAVALLTESDKYIWLGARGAGGNYSDGQISEVVHWGNDQGSSARTAIRTNMNTYYTVF